MLNFGRRTFGDLMSEIQHDDLLGQSHHQTHVVLDDGDGDTVPTQAVQQFFELFDFPRVEAGGRFIKQQDFRTWQKSAS